MPSFSITTGCNSSRRWAADIRPVWGLNNKIRVIQRRCYGARLACSVWNRNNKKWKEMEKNYNFWFSGADWQVPLPNLSVRPCVARWLRHEAADAPSARGGAAHRTSIVAASTTAESRVGSAPRIANACAPSGLANEVASLAVPGEPSAAARGASWFSVTRERRLAVHGERPGAELASGGRDRRTAVCPIIAAARE